MAPLLGLLVEYWVPSASVQVQTAPPATRLDCTSTPPALRPRRDVAAPPNRGYP